MLGKGEGERGGRKRTDEKKTQQLERRRKRMGSGAKKHKGKRGPNNGKEAKAESTNEAPPMEKKKRASG